MAELEATLVLDPEEAAAARAERPAAKSFRFPHTFVLLFLIVAAAAALTHVIPAGEYRRVDKGGHSLVDPDSFHYVESHPATIGDVFMAYPKGLSEVSAIVFYIFLIGGAFGVINATGAVDSTIGAIVRASGNRGPLVIPLLMILFSIGGGTIGMAEETLPFLPALLILSRRLGYDEVTAGAIALAGAGAGFSGAFMNPFTVGIGQAIAGLPQFSGMLYRLVCWAMVTAIAIAYVSLYAKRIRKEPSLTADEILPATRVTGRHKVVLGILVTGLALLVIGSLRWSWGIMELAGLFVAMSVVGGLAGGLGPNATAEKFLEGASGIASGALVVGLARGVLVIFNQSHITDTVVYGMAGVVRHMPASVTILGVYAVQVALSFIVPSGSGQAMLSLPILVPLADLVGVTRQTSILAFQFGDGFTHIFTPTCGYFMAGLALIKVPWPKWARFMLPLQVLWIGSGLVMLLVAHAMRWGPF